MVNQATCKHVDSLRASLTSLMHTPLNASSAAKIKTELTNVEAQIAALKGKGGSAFSNQMNQLSASVDKVKKAAGAMHHPPTVSEVTAVVKSLAELKTHAKSAEAEMNKACPKH